jgi:p-hydroxybenzoate 3-monooxygenase
MIRTQVAIVGAGPAGLMLSHLLHRAGVESIVLEARSREYIEGRVRAGVLEQGTVDLLRASGVGERLGREGLVHDAVELRFDGESHRIELARLTAGRTITVYGQQEVVKDLVQARLQAHGDIRFECTDIALHDVATSTPRVTARIHGESVEIACDFIAGCDGSHGVCRDAIPRSQRTIHERAYPFAWLGILARAAPSRDHLVYAHHDRGFALFSMRAPTLTRLYLQVAPDEELSAWPDERIWDELDRRFEGRDGWRPARGPILEKSLTGMRSLVVEPMRHERLFLAGDAAHIVPPTGAKGLNLAIADVRLLAAALGRSCNEGDASALDAYSATALKRVWRAEHFSWWMTALLHRFPEGDSFQRRLQRAQLEYVVSSQAARTSFAENYVGLPFEAP